MFVKTEFHYSITQFWWFAKAQGSKQSQIIRLIYNGLCCICLVIRGVPFSNYPANNKTVDNEGPLNSHFFHDL